MKIKKKHVLKSAMVIGAFLLIVLAAELIYIYKNKPEYFGLYYLWQSQRTIGYNFDKGTKQLSNGATLGIKFNHRQYPTLIPKIYRSTTTFEASSPEFKNQVSNYITGIDLAKMIQKNKGNLSDIYYYMAVLAHQDGQTKLAETLLQTAAYLNPISSFVQVELANLYLAGGDKDSSERALKFCLEFFIPKAHCKEYYEKIIMEGITKKPGFLQNDIATDFPIKFNY